MDEREQLIAEWVGERRDVSAGSGFVRAVMRELPKETRADEKMVVPMWVPRPALASFCLVAGIAKVLLVMQVAF